MPELLESLISHNLSTREHHRSRQPASTSSQGQDLLLSLNAGSSSLKFKVFDRRELHKRRIGDALVLSGSIKVKDDKAMLKVSDGEEKELPTADIANQETLRHLLELVSQRGRITHIVHRVVHGASLPQCIALSRRDTSALSTLSFLSSFAPLHNAVSVSMIHSLLSSPPSLLEDEVEHLCCFDTTFHHDMPETSWRYLLDPELAGSHLPGGMEMRKWGFHGISYASIVHTLSRRLGRPAAQINVIVCHLGSGSSMCAISQGKSWATTMGLTPLEGLPGGTRSGSVDPVLALHISRSALQANQTNQDDCGDGGEGEQATDPFAMVDLGGGIRVSHAEMVLNKQSGFKALCGTSDFEQVVKRVQQGDQKAKVCFDVFVEKIVEYLGAYYFKLSSQSGIDALVFSGGIGEASTDLHRALAHKLERTPLRSRSQSEAVAHLEPHQDEVTVLSCDTLGCAESREQGVAWLVCKTDEETQMAREVKAYMNW
nr:acetate kinase-like protein [Thecaphora frezii]